METKVGAGPSERKRKKKTREVHQRKINPKKKKTEKSGEVKPKLIGRSSQAAKKGKL